MGHPHEVFTVRYEDLVTDQGIQAAKLVGWRFVVVAPRDDVGGEVDPVAAIDVGVSSGDIDLASTNVGPFVESLVEAVERASDLGLPDALDLEARILEIPAIRCTGLWLAGDAPEARDRRAPRRPRRRLVSLPHRGGATD